MKLLPIPRMKYWRRMQRLSQQDLAEKLGVKSNTISRYENGSRDMDYEQARKLDALSGGFLTGSNYREPVDPKTGAAIAFAPSGGGAPC